MAYDKLKIGQRIYAARMSAGMKQESLCHEAGISQSSLSDIENGKINITVERLYKIADALDISVIWLLGELEDESNNEFTEIELYEMQKFEEYIKNRRLKNDKK